MCVTDAYLYIRGITNGMHRTHACQAGLMQAGQLSIVFTTNFKQLLEESVHRVGGDWRNLFYGSGQGVSSDARSPGEYSTVCLPRWQLIKIGRKKKK